MAAGFDEGIDAVNLAVERELIRSKLIYSRVVDSLNLSVSCYTSGEILSTERYPNKPFELLFSSIPSEYYDTPLYIDISSDVLDQYSLTFEDNVIGTFPFGETVSLPNFKFKILQILR